MQLGSGATRQRLPPYLVLLPLLCALAAVRPVRSGGAPALLAENNCRHLETMDVSHSLDPACYCYIPHGKIQLKNIWSTIQVKISSTETFEVMSIPEERNCQSSENLLAFFKCLFNNIWHSGVSNETTISASLYGEKTCFWVQPMNKALFTVHTKLNMLDRTLFLLFLTGILLFHFAHNLSRSITFYYSAGVTFGVLATLVFLLLMLKRFIPKVSTFWILMSGCWFSSLYFLYTWKEDLKWLWHHCTHYVLGYCLIVGSISFGFCHKHGPLKSEQSMNLLMWTLQFIGLVFIYVGISIPVVAYAVIVTMLCSKILLYPLRLFGYIGRKASRLFTSEKLEVRYLTEEEYREQGEQETLKALEDLRTFCRRPDFPSWVAVVKLQSPQRFAKFVLGLPHVSPEEVAAHDEQYGLGGAALEEQLFNPEAEAEPDRQNEPCEVEEDPKEEEQKQNFFSKDVL
ncbi:nuclear envelope integral membrane protein 2 isoform X2 [Podarcis raffonei]|uniref:nuclear envelope integral membrane protein 2 isoform X2 n=2 Tax=Podarcis raffonei TaxID=65483 RepID=UPI0023291C34|nr:nuclear envelope integral membrane protein 2 isoform X2 [Podarcis raffonei]